MKSLLDIDEHTTPDEIRAAVAAGADVNGREGGNAFAVIDGQVPLHCAHNAAQTKALLDAGADPNARDVYKRTPLHYAKDAEQSRALLKAGADPNARDKRGWTPLPSAHNAAQTKALLDAGADPNARTEDGRTPLHCAHDAAQTKALLEAGAEVPVNLFAHTRRFVEEAAVIIQAERQARLLAVLAEPDTAADSDGWAAIRARRARGGGRSRC